VLSRRQFLLGCAALGATAGPAGWYGTVYEPNNVEIVRRELAMPGLPAALNGIKCVQISDLHISAVSDFHQKTIELAHALRPDIVFITGDLVDVDTAVPAAVDLLAGLSPPLGMIAVPGNWDHTAGAVALLQQLLPSSGVQMLVNENKTLEQGLSIIGVDDPATTHDQLDVAMDGAPGNGARILLAHSPEIANRLGSERFGLILSGHTHGGQINLPFLNGAWLHSGNIGPYVAGEFDVSGSPLYVNRGIGTSGLPVRVAARPEITQFTLRAH
jgi:uncharacterized protein